MAFPTGILLFLTLVSLPASSFATADDEKLSAYQALQQYDFPIGILPTGMIG
ncbi:hypothetical protein V6N13_104534, partial [Hibiscus sabdariffa]